MCASIIQPLPLASRYAGAAGKLEYLHSSGSALGNTWIRRFLPASASASDHADEGMHPEDGKSIEPNHEGGAHPHSLYIQNVSNKKRKEQGHEIMFANGTRDTAGMVSNNARDMHRVNATESGLVGTCGIPKTDRVATVLSPGPPYLVSAGSSRIRVAGNQGVTKGESQFDSGTEQKMAGFGSFRVLQKPSISDLRKGTQLERNCRSKSVVEGACVESVTNQKLKFKVPDIMHAGTMLKTDYGTKCTAVPMSSLLKETNLWCQSGRQSRTNEIAGLKTKGIDADSCTLPMFVPDQAWRTAPFGVLKEGEPDAFTNRSVADHSAQDTRSLPTTKEGKQICEILGPPRLFSPFSERQKDGTSSSSPPSRPSGYNSSSDLGLPFSSMCFINQQLTNRVEASYETEGCQFRQWEQGHQTPSIESGSKRLNFGRGISKHEINKSYKDHQDTSAFPGKGLDLETTLPTRWDLYSRAGFKSSKFSQAGLKHVKFEMAGDATEEVERSGPSKRSRYDSNLQNKDLVSNMGAARLDTSHQGVNETEKTPSFWLQRWLSPSTSAQPPNRLSTSSQLPNRFHFRHEDPGGEVGKSQGYFGDTTRHGMQDSTPLAPPRQRIQGETRANGRNVMKKFSTKRKVYSFPPYPTPSAAAMALVGTAAKKIGVSPQRMGSVLKWPSVPLSNS